MPKELIKLRKAKKSGKPAFATQDSWKRKRLPASWRRPRGMHSKMRLKHKGNPKMPSQGYRSPKLVRYAHPSGLMPAVINSMKQLDSVTDEGVVISSSVGIKKKIALIKAATERKLTVLNLNSYYATKAEAAFTERKKKKAAEKAAKITKEPEESKKPGKAEKEEPKPKKDETEEEKRKTANKEMEKIITRREK
ncbi:50S ribosomal protein L32e [Candidatus Woesearchaeota archaeon]|nr:50S ribosomal protein L32e [Candidatus Woesearchaeota archaeon]